MKAPFSYFGGKSAVAPFIWKLLGDDIKRYFEPFGGSLAVLLARERKPGKIYHEIVNDVDALIINVWRALKYTPTDVARMCSDPNSHVLYWQRIRYILAHKDILLDRIMKYDSHFNIKLAAYWLYYKACEIGSIELDKISLEHIDNSISEDGLSVGRNQLMSNNGIHAKYKNIEDKEEKVIAWFNYIKKILQNTKITCLDWKRLFNDGTHWQDCGGTKNIGIFFDPPYSNCRRGGLYRKDNYDVHKEVNDFCIKNADRETYRIVVAGYEGEHNNLEDYGYTKYIWHAHGGYSNLSGSDNKYKERLWASKSCNNIDMGGMIINDYLKEVA